MREILFRGKRVDDGEWVYGWYGKKLEDLGNCSQDEITIIYNQDGDYCVIPETVGQYTGLCDKNGVKIFEGDAVTTDIARPYLIVEYRDGAFMFNCNDGGKDYYDIMLPIMDEPHESYKYGEVIGNIHDNPDLLGGDTP